MMVLPDMRCSNTRARQRQTPAEPEHTPYDTLEHQGMRTNSPELINVLQGHPILVIRHQPSACIQSQDTSHSLAVQNPDLLQKQGLAPANLH